MNALSAVDTGTMTSKGQVLIPKAIRDAAGLVPGQPYKVELGSDGRVTVAPIGFSAEDMIQRIKLMDQALAAVAGKYPFGKSTDDIMRELRGDFEP